MLAMVTWDDVYEEEEAELAYQKFMLVISSTFEECFPIGTCNMKSKKVSEPWFTPELLKHMREKK